MQERRMMGQISLWLALLCLLVTPQPAGTDPAAQPRGFDADGYADLVVGVPGESVDGEVGNVLKAGAVHVLSGYSAGVVPRDDELWHQDRGRPGVEDIAEDNDQFGSALATGDLNGDGYADLAVGVPWEQVETGTEGAVNVLYGSADGLSIEGNQFWHQGSTGIPGISEQGDDFGAVLAIGDFDGDGYDDLAVGVPGEALGDDWLDEDTGVVNVLYGTANGLTGDGSQLWHQDRSGMQGWGADGDEGFGRALAAGDFDGDGYDDLAVGVPGEEIGRSRESPGDEGAVNVLYGSENGLTASGNEIWHQDVPGVGSSPDPGDRFGYSLAAADFDGDGYDDLAVGVPYEEVGSIVEAGALNVLYGSAAGLTATDEVLWQQDSDGVDDWVEAEDRFAYALAAGDLNGDGFDDLAIGVAFEDVEDAVYGDVPNAGAVNVLYGSVDGLTGTDEPIWHQGQPDVAGAPEGGDCFGCSLAAGDLTGDGYDDLAVGAPDEDVGTVQYAGGVNILYGSSTGLMATGEGVWHQNQAGVEEIAEAYDRFGYSLAIADWYGQLPAAPENIEASDGIYTDKISITWDGVTGATSYNLWWSDSATGTRWLLTSTAGLAWEKWDATPGILYYFWVQACADTRCGDLSDYDTGYQALLPPANLQASDGTYADKIRITWDSVTGATSYGLWWSDSPTGTLWSLDTTTATSYDSTAGLANTVYHFWVTACNGPRCSVHSDPDSGYRSCDPPSAPTGLEASDGEYSDRVALTWNSVSGADTYEVFRATSLEGARTKLGEVTGTSYDDTSATPSTAYYYWVTACDSCGCGDFSSHDTGSRSGTCTDPPPTPTNVQASDGTYSDKVQVTWDAVAGVDEYQVFRSDSAAGVKHLLGLATGTSYGDTTADPGTVYYYTVTACTDACGCGDFGSQDTGYRAILPTGRVYLPLMLRQVD